MAAFLTALAALAALLLVLLAVPVELAFRVAGRPSPAGQVTIVWLFGWVTLPLDVGAPGAAPARHGPPATRPRRRLPLGALWRRKDFRRRALRFARELAGTLRVRQLRLRLRCGLDDPADTGRLWAVVGPLALLLPGRGADLRIEPDFGQAVLDWEGEGRLRLVPLRPVLLALGFAFSPVSLRTWRALRSGHA